MKHIFKIISFCLLFISLFIYFVPPFAYKYPIPTGTYCVGNQLHHNNFNINLFYPSNASIQQKFIYRPSYIQTIREALANKTHTPQFIWNILIPNLYPYIQSYAQIAQSSSNFPVILMLPGMAGIGLNLMLPTELASHGYIVCAIEPPEDIIITLFPDGKKIFLNSDLQQAINQNDRTKIYQYRNQAHEKWTAYINKTINYLETINNDLSSLFYKRLDLDRIGLLGYSHGGAVALDYCQKHKRVKAGINMDGWTKTYNSTDPLKVPFLLLIGQKGGIIDIPQINELIANNKYKNFVTKIIQDATHGSFGDGILTPWPWTYILGPQTHNAQKTKTKIQHAIISFLNQSLK